MTIEGRWWSCGKKGKVPVYFRVPGDEKPIAYARVVMSVRAITREFQLLRVDEVPELKPIGTRSGVECYIEGSL